MGPRYPAAAAAGSKAAGLVHTLTPLDDLHRSWRQGSPEDRRRFLTEMLSPTNAEHYSVTARRRKDELRL